MFVDKICAQGAISIVFSENVPYKTALNIFFGVKSTKILRFYYNSVTPIPWT